MCFFRYFIKIKQSTSLPRPCQYLPPRACLDSPSTLNWMMERTIPTTMCRIGSILAPAGGKGVNWRNWKMPKTKAIDNAQVLTVPLPSTSQGFPLRGQNLPFLLSSKSDHSFSLFLNISLKKPLLPLHLIFMALLLYSLHCFPDKTACQRLGAYSIL